MKNYLNRFFHSEDGEEGAEFLEYAVIIGLSAILIAVIVVIFFIVKGKALESGEQIDEAGGGQAHANWDQAQGNNDQEISAAFDALAGGNNAEAANPN